MLGPSLYQIINSTISPRIPFCREHQGHLFSQLPAASSLFREFLLFVLMSRWGGSPTTTVSVDKKNPCPSLRKSYITSQKGYPSTYIKEPPTADPRQFYSNTFWLTLRLQALFHYGIWTFAQLLPNCIGIVSNGMSMALEGKQKMGKQNMGYLQLLRSFLFLFLS